LTIRGVLLKPNGSIHKNAADKMNPLKEKQRGMR